MVPIPVCSFDGRSAEISRAHVEARTHQLLAIVALKIERPRWVLVEESGIPLVFFQSVDVRPDRAPLFSKLNVKVPLSIEPLARDPHLIVRWTGFRSERAGDTQRNREPERLET